MRWAALAGAVGLGFALGAAPAPADGAGVAAPPVGVRADYQLGGARPVPAKVRIVVRDRRERPMRGRYNICYLNAFQTQPGARRWWRQQHPELLLRDHGALVVDGVWGEFLLDTRTERRREALARIIGRWIDRCAADGFAAVEFDNLDSFSRSHQRIRPRDNRALARLLVARAHRAGLAAGQKNWASWDGSRIGFDFAIAEECARYRECGAYAGHYGRRVIAIEYRDADFARACRHWSPRLSVVRRDRSLRPGGERRWCRR